jgi:hypothetical protein
MGRMYGINLILVPENAARKIEKDTHCRFSDKDNN